MVKNAERAVHLFEHFKWQVGDRAAAFAGVEEFGNGVASRRLSPRCTIKPRASNEKSSSRYRRRSG